MCSSDLSITVGAISAMNQSECLKISRNLFEAREKSRVRGVIGFSLASHWLKKWREIPTPITKRSTRNRVIAFDSRVKTTQIGNLMQIFRRLSSLWSCIALLILKSTSKMLWSLSRSAG